MTQTGGSVDADAIVVGGRVAGALTAGYLAERGLQVTVLEAGSFPSDTMSTHLFRGDGLVRGLQEVGALQEVLAAGPPQFRHELFHVGSDTQVQPPQEPGEAGFGLCVRRVVLDAVVARQVASHPRVTLRTRCRVDRLLVRDGAVAGVRLADGSELLAPLVVGADGRRSLVARQAGAKTVQHHAPARVMFYQYVHGWVSPQGGPAVAPEFSLRGNELAFGVPCDSGLAVLALSLPASDWAPRSAGRQALFRDRLRQHLAMWPRVEATTPAGRLVGAAPSPSVVMAAAGPGWALVGDAGTHQDPWSGAGMDTAARQARALADAVAGSNGGWAGVYQQTRDEATLERFAATVTAAPDLTRLLEG